MKTIIYSGVLFFFVLSQVFASHLSFRIDMTQRGLFTLSSGTKQAISQISEPVYMTFFISEDLPSPVVPLRNQIQDFVKEYEARSSGKIIVSYQDPLKNTEAENLAKSLGIPPLQMQVSEKDRMQVMNVYMGGVLYTKKEETEENSPLFSQMKKYQTLPYIKNFSGFEYDLTSALLKVSSKKESVLGVVSSHSGYQVISQNMAQYQREEGKIYPIQDAIEKNYTVKQVSLSEDIEVDALLLAGITEELSEEEQGNILKFLETGGTVFVFSDSFEIENMQVLPQPSVFNTFLSSFGVSFMQEIIADASHTTAGFSSGFLTFHLPYPYFVSPKISQDSSFTEGLSSVMLPWTTPLQVKETEGVKVTPLLLSSEKYMVTPLFTEQEQEVLEEEGEEEGEKKTETVLVPSVISLDPQQDFSLQSKSEQKVLSALIEKEGQGKIFVVGNSDFLSSQFVQQYSQNLHFFLNILDSLFLGEEIAELRLKQIEDRPLPELLEEEKNMIKGINIGGSLFAVLLLAGGIKLSRKKKI
jgi:ABC-type uncharacterized transport system involved in gliding motility auxiliary subunit